MPKPHPAKKKIERFSAQAEALICYNRLVHDQQVLLRELMSELERATVDMTVLAETREELRSELRQTRRYAMQAQSSLGMGKVGDVRKQLNGILAGGG